MFGLELRDYDALFAEKLDLLLRLRDDEFVTWSGRFRAPLTGQGVYPRPLQNPLPIWLGVGGTPESFVRAGSLGLPLMVAIIGGETRRFRPLVDLYREAGRRAGHAPETLKVGVHALGYVAETTERAVNDFYPGYAHTFTETGKERGWPPVTRASFEALRGKHGALIVGNPEEVAEKVLRQSEDLGGPRAHPLPDVGRRLTARTADERDRSAGNARRAVAARASVREPAVCSEVALSAAGVLISQHALEHFARGVLRNRCGEEDPFRNFVRREQCASETR